MFKVSILSCCLVLSCLIIKASHFDCRSNNIGYSRLKHDLTDTLPNSGFVPEGYKLSFSDEFDEKQLDLNKWKYRTDQKISGGYSSLQIKENVSVYNNNLVISGFYHEPNGGGRNTGGGIISKQQFKYGYFEARVKTQAGSFWHSSFWTFNARSGHHDTEIDIFERDSQYDLDDGKIKIRQNVIEHSNSRPVTLKGSIKLPLLFDPSSTFHVYGMLWDSEHVKFFVDGVLTNTIDYSSQLHSHDENAIFLSLIARQTAQTNTICYVDYVRYYERIN